MATGAFLCGTRQLAGKTNLSKIIVDYLLQQGVVVHIIDASKSWLELSHLINVTEYAHDFSSLEVDFNKSQIHDISQLGYRNRVAVANQVCSHIYTARVRNKHITQPIVVAFEECQTYIPNNCLRNLDTYGPIVDYITIGGNFNLSYIAITQFPALVDKTLVKAAQQRYFGLTSERNDVNYVRNFIGDPESAILREQIGQPITHKKDRKFVTHFLKRGQFIYQHMGKVSVFQSPKYEPAQPVTQPNTAQQGAGYNFNFSFPIFSV
jgi:hypothetical protein